MLIDKVIYCLHAQRIKELVVMKRNLIIYILLFLLYIPLKLFSTVVEVPYPYNIPQKKFFPTIAYFKSMWAKKTLSEEQFPIRAFINGYVLFEAFCDNRQADTLSSGLILYAPKQKLLDPIGQDINSVGSFNSSMLQTRGRLKIYGPKVLDAETFGYIEVDCIAMTGSTELSFAGLSNIFNRLRTRHVYMKLTWKDMATTLLTGVFFHPIRLAHIDIEPKIVSKNMGSPIHPTARSLQIRYTKNWNNQFNILVAALTEYFEFYLSPGPDGPDDTYIRQSLMPMFSVQAWFGPTNTQYIFGTGFDIKRLMPRLVTDKCFVTRETITSCAFNIFAKLTAEPLSVRTQFIWAQNGADFGMLGGYAVSSIDPITDRRSYTNIQVLSYWIDFNLDKTISPGLFGGFTKNLGTGAPIIPSIVNTQTGEQESLLYTFSPISSNIKYMARIVPHLRIHFKPMTLGAEVEWTRAGYGTVMPSGNIENVQPVSNIRVTVGTYFFF